MSEGCRLCSGQGSFGPFGACGAGDVHRRGACPCCQGTGRTNLNVACPTCQAKGGVGAFGPCLPHDTHFKKACLACDGRGYFAPYTTFTQCTPCGGKGAVGAFGPCSPIDTHFRSLCAGCGGKGIIVSGGYVPAPAPAPMPYVQPTPAYPTPAYPTPAPMPGMSMGMPGFSMPGMTISMPGMTASFPGMGINVTTTPTVVMPAPVPTIDNVIKCTRHAHDLHYNGNIHGRVCDICRGRLGSGYQCTPCKFDLCMGCFNTLRSQGQISIPSAIPVPAPQPDVKVNGSCHIAGIGDSAFSNSNYGGTRGQSRNVEGFSLTLQPSSHDLNIEYMCHAANVGDMPWVSNGSYTGSKGQSRHIEGIAVRLSGARAHHYNVRYMVHMAGRGDSAWVSNGGYAGTKGEGRAIEGIHVIVDRK